MKRDVGMACQKVHKQGRIKVIQSPFLHLWYSTINHISKSSQPEKFEGGSTSRHPVCLIFRINQDIFCHWLDFFMEITMATHLISIKVIEKAWANNIHHSCLPSHTSHKPLDVSVMSSFKHHFSKVCKQFITKNPGRVVTEADLVSLIGIAWPFGSYVYNLISGFTKSHLFC